MKYSQILGFSLIEVLVFVTILALFFVTASAVVTVSLRNMKINEHKILATRYGEEALEWLRGEKEEDWSTFVSDSRFSSNPVTYCFNDLSWSSPTPCNTDALTPAIFKREGILERLDCGDGFYCKVIVTITVHWRELGTSYQVPLNTIFTIWE